LLVVPALLALVGCGGRQADDAAPSTPATASTTTTTTTTTTTNPPAASYAPFSIARTSNGFTLAGDMPDEATGTSLRDALLTALPGARIVTDFKTVPGAQVPDFALLGGVFGAAMGITDFGLKLASGVITLTGTATSPDAKASAASAAATAWPNVKTIDDIQVKPR
jgi:peptidoglycan-binding protein ArfA